MSKMIDELEEDISEYERTAGEKVTPRQKTMFADLLKDCDTLTELGAQDAANHRPQCGKDVFIRWIQRELQEDVERCGPIIDLFYECYTKGYNSAREGQSNGY